jgi:hypothetical protein
MVPIALISLYQVLGCAYHLSPSNEGVHVRGMRASGGGLCSEPILSCSVRHAIYLYAVVEDGSLVMQQQRFIPLTSLQLPWCYACT